MWQARPARCRTLLTPAGECASAAATESSGKNAGLEKPRNLSGRGRKKHPSSESPHLELL